MAFSNASGPLLAHRTSYFVFLLIAMRWATRVVMESSHQQDSL
jgi:hypothetical protein